MLKQELADGFEHPPPLPLDPSIVRHARPQLALTHVSDGAGEGNRTLVVSLGSLCSDIELDPQTSGSTWLRRHQTPLRSQRRGRPGQYPDSVSSERRSCT